MLKCYFLEKPNFSDAMKKIRIFVRSDKPYLLVNIGSGISILRVDGPKKYNRVGGSSLGGATFLALTKLLTKATTFNEALELAESGDSTKVDMLVRDIYGLVNFFASKYYFVIMMILILSVEDMSHWVYLLLLSHPPLVKWFNTILKMKLNREI